MQVLSSLPRADSRFDSSLAHDNMSTETNIRVGCAGEVRPFEHMRLNENEGDSCARAWRRGWNAGLRNAHAELAARERVLEGLRELRDVKPIDLRLRQALVSEDWPSAHEVSP